MHRRNFIGLLAALLPPLASAGNRQRTAPPTRAILIQQSPIAGFQFHAGETLWPQLAIGDALTLTREPDNRYDPRAVRMDWQGHKFGYVPKRENTAVAQMLDRGQRLEAGIIELRESSNPWKRVMVVVRLEI